MSTIYDGAIEYHANEGTEAKNKKDQAFSDMMELVRGALTAEQQEKLITYYVEATHSAFWEGWHGYGHMHFTTLNKEAVA